MPIYEYYCSKCQKVFELTRSFADSAKNGICPQCGSEAQKLVSVSATNMDYRVRCPEKEPFRTLPQKGPESQSAPETKPEAKPKAKTTRRKK